MRLYSAKGIVQICSRNTYDFDKIEDALIVQHPRVHCRNASASENSKGGRKSSGKRRGKSLKGKGKSHTWRNPSASAYQATEDLSEVVA